MRGPYNLLRVAEGEEWKTAFRIRYGLLKSLLMPFGLTNAPVDLQRFSNKMLYPFLDNFCTAYLDDRLIYSKTVNKQDIHGTTMQAAISKRGLHIKPNKCKFHRTEVAYLELIITNEGVRMDSWKVEAIT